MKLRHKVAMRQQVKAYDVVIEEKKQQLKRADMLVVDMRKMFSEMLDDMTFH